MGTETIATKPESVVVLHGSSLRERGLAAFLQVQPGRYLASATLKRACLTPSVRADTLLLYLVDSQRCEQLPPAHKLMLRERLQAITGSFPPTDLQARLQQQPFLVLSAKQQPQQVHATKCFCASNTAPQGMVGCEVQSRIAGTRIAAIEYLASDADGDSLSGEFTHQRDAEPVQSGLPAPLTSSCEADLGALQCVVQGHAPDQAGDLQLMLAVSDGAATLQLNSLLEITAASGDQIFIDDFETPVCP